MLNLHHPASEFACSFAGSVFMAPSLSKIDVGRYSVYRVRFSTRCGTVRIYIGHTACMDIRRVYHHTKPPAWLRCKSKEHELEYKILEANIPNRETAIALEALHAARAIAAEPEIARGGPWAKPTLKAEWKDEIDSASRIRSLLKLQELGDQNREGPLCRHLKDLEFLPAKRDALVCRGAVVRRIRRKSSGTNGNICRRRQRRRGVVKDYRRSHRGVNYEERRAVEQQNRAPRPRSSRRR